MDLIDLRNKAEIGRRSGDFSCAYALSEILYKLKRIVIKKFLAVQWKNEKLNEAVEYFEELGFEIKLGEIEYEGSADYVPITFNRRSWALPSIQMKVPVDVANKILVLGFP